MILIFEGPDKAGKSTTIRKLRELYSEDCVVIDHNPPKNNTFLLEEIKRVKSLQKRLSDELIIFDRWYFPSDIVYSPVVLQKPSVLEPYISNVERLLISVGAAFIYVTTSLDVLFKRYDDLGDDYVTKEQLEEILERYEYFFTLTQVPYIKIDTSDGDPESLAYRIDNLLPALRYRLKCAHAVLGFEEALICK